MVIEVLCWCRRLPAVKGPLALGKSSLQISHHQLSLRISESPCGFDNAGFYRGRIAAAIVDALKGRGGLLSLDDLSLHRSIVTRPIHTTYRGHTIYEVPPPTQVGSPIICRHVLACADGLTNLC